MTYNSEMKMNDESLICGTITFKAEGMMPSGSDYDGFIQHQEFPQQCHQLT
jgi:hypothetical protein